MIRAVFYSAVLITGLCLSGLPARAQYAPANEAWNRPVEPFRIAGNLYYVGANDVTSFLLTSPKGHILIDSGFRETVPYIVRGIKKLGFRVEDVKYLLITQAHFDHAAGLAELKRLTGAQLVASQEDGLLLARGGRGDFAFQDQLLFEPVKADRTISDGDMLEIGGFQMKAMITPGHTKGCTTWTAAIDDGGQTRQAVFVCSVSAPGYRLRGNPKYPRIVEDYEATFARLEKTPCDIFLSPHASQFHMDDKRAAMGQAGRNPFVDPGELRRYIGEARQTFQAQLAKEEKHSKGN